MKKLNFYLPILLIIFLISSCTKNDDLLLNNQSNKILEFKDFDELSNYLEKVYKMESKERMDYERKLGFESFGSKSEYIYLEFLKMGFSSELDIEKFVFANSHWVNYNIKDSIFEPKFTSSLYRYVVNKDRIFKIGNNVLKLYNDGVLVCDVIHEQSLYSLNSDNLVDLNVDQNVFYKYFNEIRIIENRDVPYNCGTWLEERKTSGSNRTFVRISVRSEGITSEVAPGQYVTVYYTHSEYVVRPYKRILGVWVFAERTISCDIKIAADSRIQSTGVWQRNFYYRNIVGTSPKWVEEGIWTLGAAYDGHIGGTDSWGDTPDTDVVHSECNTSLF